MKILSVLAASLALALAGCIDCPEGPKGAPVTVIDGADVRLADAHPAPVDEDDLARLAWALRKGAEYWQFQAPPLAGGTIVLHGSAEDLCGGRDALGCCYVGCARIDLAMLTDEACIEWGAAHEIGHIAIGDAQHQDPRWDSVPYYCFDLVNVGTTWTRARP